MHYVGSNYMLKWSVRLVILCVHRLPEDGTLMSKRVGVGTYHELCFVIAFFFVFYQVLLLANLLNTFICLMFVSSCIIDTMIKTPTRCNSNNLLIISISSTCFGR